MNHRFEFWPQKYENEQEDDQKDTIEHFFSAIDVSINALVVAVALNNAQGFDVNNVKDTEVLRKFFPTRESEPNWQSESTDSPICQYDQAIAGEWLTSQEKPEDYEDDQKVIIEEFFKAIDASSDSSAVAESLNNAQAFDVNNVEDIEVLRKFFSRQNSGLNLESVSTDSQMLQCGQIITDEWLTAQESEDYPMVDTSHLNVKPIITSIEVLPPWRSDYQEWQHRLNMLVEYDIMYPSTLNEAIIYWNEMFETLLIFLTLIYTK